MSCHTEEGVQKIAVTLSAELPTELSPKPSWVKISQIRTISVDRLGKRLAALDAEVLDLLIDGSLELIG
jgi:mRNA interferase MazF